MAPIRLSAPRLMGIWLVSTFWLLLTVLLWTSANKHVFEPVFYALGQTAKVNDTFAFVLLC